MQRIWHRKLPTFVVKADSYAAQVLLETMLYVRSSDKMHAAEQKLRDSALLVKHHDLARYLEIHWFSCKDRWFLSYRGQYHNEVDTTNVQRSESEAEASTQPQDHNHVSIHFREADSHQRRARH